MSPNECPAGTYGSPGSCDHTTLPSVPPAETVPPVGDGLANTGFDWAWLLPAAALIIGIGCLVYAIHRYRASR